VGVVADILLGSLGCAGCMVAGELSDLFGLLVGNIRSLVEVLIDDLFVRLVDKRCEEHNGGGDERETPEWDKLDQKVGDEGTEKGGTRYKDILGIDNTLRLNDEEVDELVEVTDERVEG